MSKSRRRFVALLGVMAIAFAQSVVAAHGFALGESAPTAHRAAIATSSAGSQHVVADHCALQANVPNAPAPNVCEVHCNDAATSPAALDLPAVVLAPLPIPAPPPVVTVADAATGRGHPDVLSSAPPIVFQFCRILI